MMSIRHSCVQAFSVMFAVLAALSTAHLTAQGGKGLTASDAWIRLPLPASKDAALFTVVENRSASLRAIVAAASDAAETVELHEMKMDNGMMRMSPVKRIDVPAGGRVELKPGGLHVMLFGLKKTLSAGDAVTVTLTFDDGSMIPVSATVRALEQMR